ncbi:hypothetical protein GCK32_021063, partial [Trichostrongylus colubriformis]
MMETEARSKRRRERSILVSAAYRVRKSVDRAARRHKSRMKSKRGREHAPSP